MDREIRCFSAECEHRAAMSLNQSEERLKAYVEGHWDERQHWREKVRSLGAKSSDLHEVARVLERDLRSYLRERATVVEGLRGGLSAEAVARLSLRNLAEYWLRVWAEPRRKPASTGRPSNDGLAGL
jgi:hypothetical protein